MCDLFQGSGKSEEGDYCPLAILAHQEEWEGSQVLSTVPETIPDDDLVLSTISSVVKEVLFQLFS